MTVASMAHRLWEAFISALADHPQFLVTNQAAGKHRVRSPLGSKHGAERGHVRVSKVGDWPCF